MSEKQHELNQLKKDENGEWCWYDDDFGVNVYPEILSPAQQVVDHLENQVKELKEGISELRDRLYESLPTGKIHAFTYVELIKLHIDELDELLNKQP